MKTLKQEEVQDLAYKDADDNARRRIATFIGTVYNTPRLHSALDSYLTPEEYEHKHSGDRWKRRHS